MLLTNADPEYRKKLYPNGLTKHPPNCPGCSSYDIQPIVNVLWTSIQALVRNVANRHDAALTMGTVKQSSQTWNSLAICFAASVMPKISWKTSGKSFHPFFRYGARKSDPENRKMDPWSKGLNITSAKCSRLYLVWCRTYIEKFMKIDPSVFPQCY